MRTKQELLLSIPFEYLLGFIEETILTRGKNNYFTKKDFVHCLINSLDFSECEWLVKNYENDMPYKKAASEYLEFHPTGNMLTKKFSDVIKKPYNEEIILYEFLIPSTRADIVQIGDLSQAYELKSLRDSFKRILNQILALEKIFDITYIVVSFDALKECEKYVDDIVGIYIYNVRKDGVSFKLLKSAKRSNFINPKRQLDILHKPELINLYKNSFHETPNCSIISLKEKILSYNSPEEINLIFKETIKNRYFSFQKNLC